MRARAWMKGKGSCVLTVSLLLMSLLFWPAQSASANNTTFSGEATVVQATVLGLPPVVLSDTGALDSTGGAREASLLDAREVVERTLGQCGRAMLHRTRHSVFVARDLRERLERLEIELHVGDTAVGEHHATVRRARLYGDLGEANGTGRALLERRLHFAVCGAKLGIDWPKTLVD